MQNDQPKTHIVDLSHTLIPCKEQYKLVVYPDTIRKKPHGVLFNIDLWSHVGTHIEYALHFMPDGNDLSKLPLWRVVGQAVRVDLRGRADDSPMDVEDFKRYEIRKDDIVIVWTGCEARYRKVNSHNRPYVTEKAADWMANEIGIAALGTDASGFDVRDGSGIEKDHFIFFDREDPIPAFECLKGLGDLKNDRFFFLTLPLSVEGVDAWPLRILGIEGVDEASNQIVLDQLTNIFSVLK